MSVFGRWRKGVNHNGDSDDNRGQNKKREEEKEPEVGRSYSVPCLTEDAGKGDGDGRMR